MSSREIQPCPRDLHVGEDSEELRLLGELHGRSQVALGLLQAAPVEQVPDKVHVRTAGVLDVACLQGDPERLIQGGLTSRIAETPAGDADCWSGRAP